MSLKVGQLMYMRKSRLRGEVNAVKLFVLYALQGSGGMLLKSFTGRSLRQGRCCNITLMSPKGTSSSSSWREEKPTFATTFLTGMCMRGTWERKWLTIGNLT